MEFYSRDTIRNSSFILWNWLVKSLSLFQVGIDHNCLKISLINWHVFFLLMGRRKTQKIIKTGPKNVTTGMCPLCKTIGRIFIIGQPGQEKAKCPACNQQFELWEKKTNKPLKKFTHNFLRTFSSFTTTWVKAMLKLSMSELQN